MMPPFKKKMVVVLLAAFSMANHAAIAQAPMSRAAAASPPSIYASGYIKNGPVGAAVWTNIRGAGFTSQLLPPVVDPYGKGAVRANGIWVVDNPLTAMPDVHVAGESSISMNNLQPVDSAATLWKNGAVVARYEGTVDPFDDRARFAGANSIQVDNGSVLLGGFINHSSVCCTGSARAVTWFNGVMTMMEYESRYNGYVHKAERRNGVTYAVGELGGQPMLWINGKRDSNGGVGTRALSTSSTTLYVGGQICPVGAAGCPDPSPRATVYSRSLTAPLGANFSARVQSTKESGVNDLKAVGSTVYAVGWERVASNQVIAKLWVNGASRTLQQTVPAGVQYHAAPSSVFVHGSDVYVAGSISVNNGRFKAVIWKNGTVIYQDTVNTESSIASIFVK